MRPKDPKRLFLRFVDRGDAAALGRVFDQLAPELLALALHLTRDLARAEDALQDTFLAAIESAPRFDRTKELRPWLVGILVHRARRSRRTPEGGEFDGVAAAAVAPSAAIEASEIAEHVATAIRGLAEPYRAVVDAHVTEGLAPREIAVRLDRPPSTIRAQLHRGLAQLRERLEAGGARNALGRASALLVAAPGLGDAAARASVLANVRAEVLGAAAKARPEVLAAKLGVAPKAALTAAAAASAVGLGLLLSGSADDGDVGAGLPPRAGSSAAVEAAPPADLALSIGLESAGRTADRRTPLESPAPDTQANTKSASKRSAAARDEPGAALPELERWPYVALPTVGSNQIDGFDPLALVRISARTAAGEPLSSDVVPLPLFDGIALGSYAFPEELGRVIARFDHPDALPFEFELGPSDFMRQGERYVGQTSILLDPIDTTLQVPRRGGAEAFQGTVQAVGVEYEGRVYVHDERPYGRERLGPGELAYETFRISYTGEMHYVVPIPESEEALTYAQLFHPAFGENVQFESAPVALTTNGPLRTNRAAFTLLDPFGEPLSNARVEFAVPSSVQVMVGTPEKPLVLGGRVACDPTKADFSASLESGAFSNRFSSFDRPDSQSLLSDLPVLVLAKPVLKRQTDATGAVSLQGVLVSVVETRITTAAGLTVDLAELRIRKGAEGNMVLDAPLGAVSIALPESMSAHPPGLTVRIGEKDYPTEVRKRPGSLLHTAEAVLPPDAYFEVHVEVEGVPWSTVGFTRAGSVTTPALTRSVHGKPCRPSPDEPR